MSNGPYCPPSSAGDVDAGIDFENLFETAPCGYVLADKDGRITRANQTFAQWTGYPAALLIGRRFSDLLPVVGKIFYETHFVPMLHIQGRFTEVALEIVSAGNQKIPVIVNASMTNEPDGVIPSIRFTLFVSAERRSYERGLLAARNEAQATILAERVDSELREQFIAVLGHDLRNPIASIGSGVHLLGKEALTDRGRKILELMGGSVVRAAGLIDNVLDFARGRLGGGITLMRDARESLEPVLRQVVAELRSIAAGQRVEAIYAIAEPVNCDRVRIGQLLSNLLGNALTHGAKDQPVRLEASTDADALIIAVTNGGAPIPTEAFEHLFQPFYRGGDKGASHGLGLGLHIAAEIARAHGGSLTVQSDEAQTCFTFTMPLRQSASD